MKPRQDDPVESSNTLSTDSQALSPLADESSGESMSGREETDGDLTLVRKALAPALLQQRSLAVAEPREQSLARRQRPVDGERITLTDLHARCRQLCVKLFFREPTPVQSLGVTSAVGGEGKTFLARLIAQMAAQDHTGPTTLLECNWDHPSVHKHFGIPPTPGLAEWLRGECDEQEIRCSVGEQLSVIPAGDDRQEAVKLLRRLQRGGLRQVRAADNGLVIIDLPPIISSGYGLLAASLVEALVVVVRAGVTPRAQLKATCDQLQGLPVAGFILNQRASRIPRWISSFL
jgi:Mrp family chromosome partitioning ATPase